MAEGFQPITVDQFNVMFEALFNAHDANHNGFLEKDECRELLKVVNSKRPDGHEFNEENFNALFDKHAVDGKIGKDSAHALALKRGQTLGFIQA